MRCVVPSCKNDSRDNFKAEGITFHSFPADQTSRISWLSALDRPHFQIKEGSTICSEHFLVDDMYETQCGLRKVRAGAIPVINQNSRVLCDPDKPIKICRMCLTVTNRLYSIKKYQLERTFERLTGLSLNSDDRLPRELCSVCATRLRHCHTLRESALKAHTILVDLLKTSLQITQKNLDTASTDFQFLTEHIPSNVFHFEHSDDVKPEVKGIDTEQEMDIKKEDDSIFVDDLSPKNETVYDGALAPLSDKGFDTDDSIPLEAQRKKRKKVKKQPMKKIKKPKPTEPKIDRRRKPFLNQDLNETLFTVTDLTVEEQLAEVLKRQETDNYKHSVFKCTECFKGFLDQDAYSSHMVRHTSECGDYRCEICKTHFKHSHALRKHITAHHLQRFSCNHCPYVTTHRQTARLHERWHKGTKYQCPHCNLEFVKFTTYMGHVRIKHPSDFVCELCGFSFVSAKGIELHKKLKHRGDQINIPEDGPYCELCNVRFVSTDAHRKHMSVSARHAGSDRENNKPTRGRKCRDQIEREKLNNDTEEDDKRRMYPSQMRKSEGPISCEQCGMELEDSRAYHGHFRRMHPDKNRTNYPSMKSPCMCEVCGRIFQSFALLKDHTWVHTGERPFKCDQCGKSFRMKQRLVAHRRVHSDVKASYVCTVCGKHFSTHSNRQRHMFIHTGLKPFKCEMCGKGFKHASEKRAHVSYVHLKKPWPKRARAKRPVRQGSLPPASGASEMDIQPVWPAIDPKLADINMIDDKPMYYR